MAVFRSLAISVPSGPGFIGVFQYVELQTLVLPFGAKHDAGTPPAAMLTAHRVNHPITTALGALSLWRFGESLSGLGLRIGRNPPASDSRSTANAD